jgi:hypothetical protein
VSRALAASLACAQLALGLPISAEQVGKKAAAATVPPKVTVNRTRPAVTPPTGTPVFSETPTDAEITRARVFSEVLLPAGPTTGAENRALADLITAYHDAAAPERIDGFAQFVRQHPDSAGRRR